MKQTNEKIRTKLEKIKKLKNKSERAKLTETRRTTHRNTHTRHTDERLIASKVRPVTQSSVIEVDCGGIKKKQSSFCRTSFIQKSECEIASNVESSSRG